MESILLLLLVELVVILYLLKKCLFIRLFIPFG